MKACNRCGEQAADDATLCAKCGAPFEGAPATPQFMTPPPGGAPPAKAKSPAWIWIVVAGMAVLCLCPILLAAILFPVFAQAKKSAQANVAMSQAKQVDLAMQIYLNDSDEVFPPFSSAEDVTDKLSTYFKTSSSSPESIQTLEVSSNSYEWNLALSAGDESTIPMPAMTWLFHAKQAEYLDKTVVGYVDGHTMRVAADEFGRLMSKPTEISKPSTVAK